MRGDQQGRPRDAHGRSGGHESGERVILLYTCRADSLRSRRVENIQKREGRPEKSVLEHRVTLEKGHGVRGERMQRRGMGYLWVTPVMMMKASPSITTDASLSGESRRGYSTPNLHSFRCTCPFFLTGVLRNGWRDPGI